MSFLKTLINNLEESYKSATKLFAFSGPSKICRLVACLLHKFSREFLWWDMSPNYDGDDRRKRSWIPSFPWVYVLRFTAMSDDFRVWTPSWTRWQHPWPRSDVIAILGRELVFLQCLALKVYLITRVLSICMYFSSFFVLRRGLRNFSQLQWSCHCDLFEPYTG